ncbi:MAG: response regulator [Brevundimonas sp.]|uniref:response regulator n=1 Tax=Brevundimonas sp. TaxID=1871086 RepID=UPI00271B8EDA|nr:response regulator [Brevundimonas sp.]MDO9588022.1 response regulator [Brevundimonas sp.]
MSRSPRPRGDACVGGETFDLVFSDMVMPGDMDGLALAKAVRERHPGLPVVLTAGYSEAAATATATAERFHLLSKPYGIDALETVLGEPLSEARGRAPTSTTRVARAGEPLPDDRLRARAASWARRCANTGSPTPRARRGTGRGAGSLSPGPMGRDG